MTLNETTNQLQLMQELLDQLPHIPSKTYGNLTRWLAGDYSDTDPSWETMSRAQQAGHFIDWLNWLRDPGAEGK